MSVVYLLPLLIGIVFQTIAAYPLLFLAEAVLASLVGTFWRRWLARVVAALLIATVGMLVIVGVPPLELTGGPSGEEQLAAAILGWGLFFGGIVTTAAGVLLGHLVGRD
jgi:hypothetical protein